MSYPSKPSATVEHPGAVNDPYQTFTWGYGVPPSEQGPHWTIRIDGKAMTIKPSDTSADIGSRRTIRFLFDLRCTPEAIAMAEAAGLKIDME